jgi:hypothetical protein
MSTTPLLRASAEDVRAIEAWLQSHRETDWLMRQPRCQDRDGRPALLPVASTVNAGMVRVCEPWRSTGKVSLIASGADFGCYIVHDDGSREPFEAYKAVGDAARRRTAGVDAADSYDDRLAAFGSVGVQYD